MMDTINFFKFIGEKRPKYSWEEIKKQRKDEGEEIPLEREGANMLNGKKNGVFVKYSTDWDGTDEDKKLVYLYTKLTYKDGILNGPFAEYFSNGLPYLVGNYKRGRWEGELIYYYPDFKPRSVYNMVNDKKNGKQFTYYGEGTVESEIDFVDGDRHGESLVYYTNGNLKLKEYYINNRRNGPYEKYDEDGNIKEKGTYKTVGDEGYKQTGEISFYHIPVGDENVKNKVMFVKNVDTGDEIKYDHNGKKTEERISLGNDITQTTTYGDNGVTMVSTFNSADNKLISLNIYKDGKLISSK
jgi:antitoxin component YwqK of YwqJK toxin-antitoxin module